MTQRELYHAVRYATHATDIHFLETYRQRYPDVFENAVMETRPATARDYYIPPPLADRCRVLEEARFDEIGCKRLGCFPVKENLEPCDKTDPPRWVQLGQQFALACQPACQLYPVPVDTEWSSEGRCVLSNPLKKVLAMFPEKIFERKSRHTLHGGLDVVDGHLKLNPHYCRAYGMDFEDGDCYLSAGQTVGEFLLGMTVVRQIKTASAPWTWKLKAPPLPDYLVVRQAPRTKRSADHDDTTNVFLDKNFYKDLAIDISLDLGIQVTASVVRDLVGRKTPRLVNMALQSLATRTAMKQSVLVALQQLNVQAFGILAKSVGAASAIFAVYSLVSLVVDLFDPFDYRYVLSRDQLSKIDRLLDYECYQGARIRPEVTPLSLLEYDVLRWEEDESDRYAYMAERIQEYLDALHTPDVSEEFSKWIPPPPKEKPPEFRSMPYALLFVLVCFMVLYVEWIHVWAVVCFGIFLVMVRNQE